MFGNTFAELDRENYIRSVQELDRSDWLTNQPPSCSRYDSKRVWFEGVSRFTDHRSSRSKCWSMMVKYCSREEGIQDRMPPQLLVTYSYKTNYHPLLLRQRLLASYTTFVCPCSYSASRFRATPGVWHLIMAQYALSIAVAVVSAGWKRNSTEKLCEKGWLFRGELCLS